MGKQENIFGDEEEKIVQPVDEPIICNPFVEPEKHWFYNENGEPILLEKRREASYWYKDKKAYTKQASLFAEEQRDALPLINLLRVDVKRWRKSGYELATPVTKKLLEHWNRTDRERKLFFCQRESVETIIYINEILATGRKPRWNTELSYEDYLKLTNGEQPSFFEATETNKEFIPRLVDIPNEQKLKKLTRYGCKMATGSGKTVVMSMLLAWAFCNRGAQPSDNRFPRAALILCPNLTIKNRLNVLRPDDPDNYYEKFDLVPSSYRPLLAQGKIIVTNWHQLKQESEHAEGGETYRIVNKGEESNDAFARRILGDLYDDAPIMVMNDEGHHAYRPKQVNPLELTEEERKELEEATIWVSGIDRINASCGVKFCIDLSATPFYIQGSGYAEGSPFPWLVSDFGLVDAIESGIVKIPRIPVNDSTGAPEPKYFALWKSITKDLKAGQKLPGGGPKPDIVWERGEDALQQLAGEYKKRFDNIFESDVDGNNIPPVMIVVCDNTTIAELFYKNISGEQVEETEQIVTRGKKKGQTKIVKTKSFGSSKLPGALGALFGNSNSLNTIRIDSKVMDDSNEAQTKDEAKQQLRGIVDTIGQRGKPGEKVHCVVSVQMLTEGWDASNVTHILGLRAFGSQLLIEQVVGRGLRRMSYEIDPETNMFSPEYVDVYGIPFSIIPFKGKSSNAQTDDKPVKQVKAIQERKHLEIKFPVVEGYVFDLQKNQIKIDFDSLEGLEIEPMSNPIQTFIQPQVGYKSGLPSMDGNFEIVQQDRKEYYANTHIQTIKFEITKQIVNNLTEGRKFEKPRLQHFSRAELFPQVLKYVDRYVDEKVNFHGADKREIGLDTYSKRISELITAAVMPNESEGEPPLLPQLNKYRPTGSTSLVNFSTRKPTKNTRKSHVSHVVADTAKWEQSAAFYLETNELEDKVESYVKNDHLEFNIPYEYEGQKGYYEPDFLVKLKNGITVVLEVKGYEDNMVKAKHQGAKKWIAAVNNWGKLGRWEFAVCRNPANVKSIIDSIISKAKNLPAHISAMVYNAILMKFSGKQREGEEIRLESFRPAELTDKNSRIHITFTVSIDDEIILDSECPDPPCHEVFVIPRQTAGKKLTVRADGFLHAEETKHFQQVIERIIEPEKFKMI